MDLVINCPCFLDGCSGLGLIVATNADLNAWRRAAANISGITCSDCGCTQNLADGGNHIAQVDVSMPRIDIISPIEGFSGTTATIHGHRLNLGSLVVKFGNTIATISSRSENFVTVIIPSNPQGQSYDISVENENGIRPVGGKLQN